MVHYAESSGDLYEQRIGNRDCCRGLLTFEHLPIADNAALAHSCPYKGTSQTLPRSTIEK